MSTRLQSTKNEFYSSSVTNRGTTARQTKNCTTCNNPIMKHDELKMIEIGDFVFHEQCCV